MPVILKIYDYDKHRGDWLIDPVATVLCTFSQPGEK